MNYIVQLGSYAIVARGLGAHICLFPEHMADTQGKGNIQDSTVYLPQYTFIDMTGREDKQLGVLCADCPEQDSTQGS